MSIVDEATQAMKHATFVLAYIKHKYPEVFQEALDRAGEESDEFKAITQKYSQG
jgi:hypothetical protein